MSNASEKCRWEHHIQPCTLPTCRPEKPAAPGSVVLHLDNERSNILSVCPWRMDEYEAECRLHKLNSKLVRHEAYVPLPALDAEREVLKLADAMVAKIVAIDSLRAARYLPEVEAYAKARKP